VLRSDAECYEAESDAPCSPWPGLAWHGLAWHGVVSLGFASFPHWFGSTLSGMVEKAMRDSVASPKHRRGSSFTL